LHTSVSATWPPGLFFSILRSKKFDAIILTFDKDYGEIIFKLQVVDPPSVIFFREKGNNPLFAGSILIELLAREDLVFEGRYTGVEKNGVRQRDIS
jgi:hypothetical protein